MLDILDRNLGRVYNKIISNRIVNHIEKILPFVVGIDIPLPQDYSMLKETIKEYKHTIIHAIKKYLMY